jgi:hypothetical protein
MPFVIIVVVGLLMGGACMAALGVLRERRAHNTARQVVRQRLAEQHSWESTGSRERVKGISARLRKSFHRIRLTRQLETLPEEAETPRSGADTEKVTWTDDDINGSTVITAVQPIPAMPRMVSMTALESDAKANSSSSGGSLSSGEIQLVEQSQRPVNGSSSSSSTMSSTVTRAYRRSGSLPEPAPMSLQQLRTEQCSICLTHLCAVDEEAGEPITDLIVLPCGHTL